ncbi:DUF1513 domain-containing protein [Sneathiella sp. P13V-1]|uniref:DUF1513 domain-containing protein n=1 Tax=Sneathiella sp. P13V-1 TaxID=2697366 RepID=UPI00187B3221|nr:DUF1513 domain-containing protein [Sneathiella sp. P13V-1]MBE7635975.1 DUF1513 domain-containing protein [Sneathiella sp. P13V-1]
MVTNRRIFMQGALALGAVPFLGKGAAASTYRFAVAGKAGTGYIVAVLDGGGSVLQTYPLEGRGHGLAVSPDGRKLAVFARRPGYYIRMIDLQSGEIERDIDPISDRHFYGHGFFTPDGNFLYATENDFDGEQGVLGIYDTRKNYVRVGEIDTGGIGPHEALMMSDGKTIAVANGGIATHPDFPRQKLNVSEMKPSMVLLDAVSGDLMSRATLPSEMHKLSIRHISEGNEGRVWFAGQQQGDKIRPVDMVGYYSPGKERLELVSLPEEIAIETRNYGGSVSANPKAGLVAVSAPRGNMLLIFDEISGQLKDVFRHQDICAVSPKEEWFIGATGRGAITISRNIVAEIADFKWDNHAIHL